ncbi:MAG: flippase-like domain-containing protein [Proteobacteria bacterium]|nr:flippase-like domain-containing protein [Pseudomonadota bacterium]MBU4259994.1 flippase-like domain-containing protein [Pseudomonadota bacterium]MBU4287833.1 flippase-like domain-containing protein [Pseudomonadota bacterium]
MKSNYRWIGLGLGVVALIYFINQATANISALPPVYWDLNGCAGFAGAIVLNIVVILLGGYAWSLLLRASGESVANREVLIIFTLAQFAKYIPGNIAHHAGRIVLAKSRGFKLPRVLLTMSLEVGWNIVAACTLITVSLPLIGQKMFETSQALPSVFQLVLAIIAGITLPIIGGWVIFSWRPGPLRMLFGDAEVITPGIRPLLFCLLIYMLCFFLMGLASDLLSRGLFGVTESYVCLLTGAFAVAWVAGFITPGAPAGLGVREAILLGILSPVYGSGIAAGIAIALRAVTTLADGLTFLAAVIAKRKFLPPIRQIPR